jgi:hypothetical protein
MGIDMLLEYVARDLSIDLAIIWLVVGEAPGDEEAKA